MTLRDEKVLAFVAGKNTHRKSDNRLLRDATGAFIPEANRFVKLAAKGSRVVLIDNSKPFAQRRKAVEAEVNGGELFDSVAFFCHGWSKGIQLGYTKANVKALAALVLEATGGAQNVSYLTVPLYCCSTGDDKNDEDWSAAGSGDNSFADLLRDELCRQGAVENRVMAHTSVAHTTKNPMVLFMDGMGIPDGGVGGFAPVAPGTANWSTWKRLMRDSKGTLRFRMPYMDIAQIHKELGRAPR